MRGRGIVVEDLDRGRHQHPPALHAVEIALLEDALRPRDPTTALCHLSHQRKSHAQPQRIPGGPHQVSQTHAFMMGAGPEFGAFPVAPDKVRGRRQPLQIGKPERRFLVHRRQLGVRIGPRVQPERCPPTINDAFFSADAHRRSHFKGPPARVRNLTDRSS